ncbi:MAG: M15 family metallopeptidase [Actinomycetota bacterium]
MLASRHGVATMLVRCALALVTCVVTTPVSGASAQEVERAWVPPAYLMWRTGGLPTGLTPELDGLRGTEHVVVVSGDTLWMSHSVRADGTVVDRRKGLYRIPVEVMSTSARDMAPFLPPAWRDAVVDAWRDGRGVLGESSAALRRLGVGDRFVFGRNRITVGAIVPDEVVAWSELMVSGEVGRSLGVRHARFALMDMRTAPSERELARRIAHLLAPGYPPRVRRPGHAWFRRQGDSVWPPVLMKRGFGEFRAYPDPRRPGYLRMQPAFVRDNLATRRVPLLGRFSCHERLFPRLIAAMRELRERGRGEAIRNFAGCYSARMVMRRPNGAISHHSWGAAVDINSLTNPYGSDPRQPAVLVRVMRERGFAWGGRWTVPDGMHFEFVDIPGVP